MLSRIFLELNFRKFWSLTHNRVYLVEHTGFDRMATSYSVCLSDSEFPQELRFRSDETKDYYIQRLKKLGVKIVSAEAELKAAKRRERKKLRKITKRLWTIARDKTSLLEVKDNDGNIIDYLICNEVDRMLHLQDRRLHQYVIARMKKSGVKIIVATDENEKQRWLRIAQEDAAKRDARYFE